MSKFKKEDIYYLRGVINPLPEKAKKLLLPLIKNYQLVEDIDSEGRWFKKGDAMYVSDVSVDVAKSYRDSKDDPEFFSHINDKGQFVDVDGFAWKYAVKAKKSRK